MMPLNLSLPQINYISKLEILNNKTQQLCDC